MTYDELVRSIQAYLENNFPALTLSDGTKMGTTEQIDRFLEQAEQRIYNTVQFPSLRKNVTGTLTATNKYLSAPTDFLAVYSFAVVNSDGSYEYLLNKDVNFIRQAYPQANDTGLPRYYALFGSQTNDVNELTFILGPTPDATYPVELHYYYYPTSMTDTVNNPTGTTWLGDNFSSALLYGSLVEAYTFMKGEQDLMAVYDAKYKEALMLLKNLGDGKQRGDAYLDGQVKVKVQ
mgnify:CR=1 FL=1